MSGVSLDTSGVVYIPRGDHAGDWAWRHLSPFEQGYVAAAKQAHPIAFDPSPNAGQLDWAFHHLAPETLAAIRKDCAAWETIQAMSGVPRTFDEGARLWRSRQMGLWPTFPPLALTLGDDGKVRFQ